jgi:hypothetical protein
MSEDQSRRTFAAETKRLAWKRCENKCQSCGAPVTGAGDIVYDHIVPWILTRDSSLANCQVLCLTCDDIKTHTRDLPAIAKADRQGDFHRGISGPGLGRSPMPCGRNSPRRRTLAGRVVERLSQAERHVIAMRERFGWLA